MFFYQSATGSQPMMFAAPMSSNAPMTAANAAGDRLQGVPEGFSNASNPSNNNNNNNNNATATNAAAPQPQALMAFPGGVMPSTNTDGSAKQQHQQQQQPSSNPNNSSSNVFSSQTTTGGGATAAMPVSMPSVPLNMSMGGQPSAGGMANATTTASTPPSAALGNLSPQTHTTTVVAAPPGMSIPSLPQAHMLPVLPVTTSPGGSGILPLPGTTTTATATSTPPNSTMSPPSYEAVVLDPNGPRSQTNLFVRKLASAVTEKDVQSLFEPFGTILSFGLMRNIHTGEPLGTAFVRFAEHEEAKTAMEVLEGKELYGRAISIQWAKKHHDGTPVGEARKKIHKVFVRNVPLDVAGKELRAIFSEHGEIANVTLHADTAPLTNADGTSSPSQRNIAFIVFQNDGAAEEAVRARHNTCPFPSCNGIPLMVKLAEDNRQRLERKHKLGGASASASNQTLLLPSHVSDAALADLSNRLRTPETGLPLGVTHASSTTPGTSPGNSIPPMYTSVAGTTQTSQTMAATSMPPGAVAVPGGYVFPMGMQQPQQQPVQPMMPQQSMYYPYQAAAPGTQVMAAYPSFYMTSNGMASAAPMMMPAQPTQGQPQYFFTMDANGNPVATAAFPAQQQQQQQQQQPMFFSASAVSGAPGTSAGNVMMAVPVQGQQFQQPQQQQQAPQVFYTTGPNGQPQAMMMVPVPVAQAQAMPQQTQQQQQQQAPTSSPNVNMSLYPNTASPDTRQRRAGGSTQDRASGTPTPHPTSLSGTPVQTTFSGVQAVPMPLTAIQEAATSSAGHNKDFHHHVVQTTVTSSSPAMMGLPTLMSAGRASHMDPTNAGKSQSSMIPPRMSSMPDLPSPPKPSVSNTAVMTAMAAGDDSEDEEDLLFVNNMGAHLNAGDDSDDGSSGGAQSSADAAKNRRGPTASSKSKSHSAGVEGGDDEDDIIAFAQDVVKQFRHM